MFRQLDAGAYSYRRSVIIFIGQSVERDSFLNYSLAQYYVIRVSAEAKDNHPKYLVWSEFTVSKFLEHDAYMVH